jgi:predicted dehydrogenase
MPAVKVAIVGAHRGRHHGRIWGQLPEVDLVGICDKDPERRYQAQLEFEKPVFHEYDRMLDDAKPHVVHVVTSPAIPRHTWIKPAYEAGVRVVILEKPHALTPFEHKMVCNAVESCGSGMEVLVNHQRRYMTAFYALRELLAEGALGTLTHVYVQSQGEIMETGTHVMDLILMIAGEEFPGMVWGTVNGDLYDAKHLKCPENLMAIMGFSPQYRVCVEVTNQVLRAPDWSNINRSKYKKSHFPNRLNLFVHGKRGDFWWREYGGWGYCVKTVSSGEVTFEEDAGVTDYFVDDVTAQKRFDKHVWRNLQHSRNRNPQRPAHWARFELARKGLEMLFMLYKSALLGKPISYPEKNGKLSQEDWQQLRKEMKDAGR